MCNPTALDVECYDDGEEEVLKRKSNGNVYLFVRCIIYLIYDYFYSFLKMVK